MKKKLALLTAVVTVGLMATGAYARDNVSVTVDGQAVEFDQPPVISNGRTLVPLRGVLEKMGAEVEWDADTRTATCTYGELEVSLALGSERMSTTQGDVYLDEPARIINSRIMVPIRAISEGIGATVDWDGDTGTVIITSPHASSASTPETEAPVQAAVPTYDLVEGATEIKEGDTLAFVINTSYPVITGEAAGIEAVNAAIKADAQARVEAYTAEEGEYAKEFIAEGGTAVEAWSCDIDYEVKYLDSSIVSLYITEVSYTGGAHPNTYPSGLTYNLETGERMSAEDFVENALEVGKTGVGAMVQADPDAYPLYDETTFALDEDDWYIDGSKLVFIVAPYEIAPYAAGIINYAVDLSGI